MIKVIKRPRRHLRIVPLEPFLKNTSCYKFNVYIGGKKPECCYVTSVIKINYHELKKAEQLFFNPPL